MAGLTGKNPRTVGKFRSTTSGSCLPRRVLGGRQNIFRFLSLPRRRPVTPSIFLYWSPGDPLSAQVARTEMSSVPTTVLVTYALYDPKVGVGDDALTRSSRPAEAAYPHYLSSLLRTGLRALVLPRWIEASSRRTRIASFTAGSGWPRAPRRYGMTTHPFDFAAEMTLCKRTNDCGARTSSSASGRCVVVELG